MKKTFQVENVKCGGCAQTLRTKLEPLFGPVRVDLMVQPREITLEIEDERLDELRAALREIGYPLSSEKLGFVSGTEAKVKSFVSCAVGRMQKDEES